MQNRYVPIMLAVGIVGAVLALVGLSVDVMWLAAVGVGAAIGSAGSFAFGGRPPRAATLSAAEAPLAASSDPVQPTSAPTETPAASTAIAPLPASPAGVEPADVVAAFALAAGDAGEVAAAHLWLADPATSTLRLVAATGHMRPTGDPVPIAGTTLGAAITGKVAVLNAEQRHGTSGGEVTLWRYAIPLDAGDAHGVAAVDVLCDQPDRESLNRSAASLRGAFAGALAMHVARQETIASRALIDTARDLSRLVDPKLVVSSLLTRAMRLAGAQTGSVMLLGEDGLLRIEAAAGLPDDVVRDTAISSGEGIAGWVAATGQPLVVEDLEQKRPQGRRHGVRSAISVPIADDEGTLGVLNVGSRSFHARVSQSSLDSLETLARTGAVALRNARAVETSRSLYFDTLKALALALETKDPYARGATERVVDLALALGAEIGLTSSEQQALHVAAMLHDVGMSAAGDFVTASDRPLSTVEWGMLKMHPVIAADVLEQAPALREAIPIVYHHHERYDGGGYVTGLAAEQIPLGARVLAVADAYVAVTSDRPHRKAKSPADALEEIRAHSGSQFDPEVVDALIDILGDSTHAKARH